MCTIGSDLNLTVLAVLAMIIKFNVHQHWVLVKQSTLNVVLFAKLNVYQFVLRSDSPNLLFAKYVYLIYGSYFDCGVFYW